MPPLPSTALLIALACSLLACGTDTHPAQGALDASSDADADAGDASDSMPTGDANSGADADADADALHTPCDGSCKADAPHCDSASDRCVACLGDQHCENDPSRSRCVAGACAPCETDQHCGRISNGSGTVALGVCDQGTCVECTGESYAACGKNEDDKQRVCNSLEKTCSTSTERSAGLCVPCVADAQCALGTRCVPQEFDGQDLGYFCMWQKAAGIGGAPGSCSAARPFVQTRTQAKSIDRHTADVCELASTTCEAFHQFRTPQGACGTGTSDNAACGAPGLNDAMCVLLEAGATGQPDINRCTMPCLSSDDCLPNSACDTSASPRYCGLQTGACYGNADCSAGKTCQDKQCK